MNWVNRICDLESLRPVDLEQIGKAMDFFGGTPDFITVDSYDCVTVIYVDNDPIYGDWVNLFTWYPDDKVNMSAYFTRGINEKYE